MKYGINKKTLTRYLKERNIPIIQNFGAYSINEKVFEKIDSEEKAYWLGFLYADGFVGAKNNQIGLGVALKDINHLEKYKQFLPARDRDFTRIEFISFCLSLFGIKCVSSQK